MKKNSFLDEGHFLAVLSSALVCTKDEKMHPPIFPLLSSCLLQPPPPAVSWLLQKGLRGASSSRPSEIQDIGGKEVSSEDVSTCTEQQLALQKVFFLLQRRQCCSNICPCLEQTEVGKKVVGIAPSPLRALRITVERREEGKPFFGAQRKRKRRRRRRRRRLQKVERERERNGNRERNERESKVCIRREGEE